MHPPDQRPGGSHPGRMSLPAFCDLELQLYRKPSRTSWFHFLYTTLEKITLQELQAMGLARDDTHSFVFSLRDPCALLAVGSFLVRSGQYEEGLDLLDRSQDFAPTNRITMLWRAMALAQLKRFDEADSLFATVGKQFASPARVCRMGGRFWNEMATLTPPAALDQTWLTAPPANPDTVVLVSMDSHYALQYAGPLLHSWARMLDDGDSAQRFAGRAHLHIHLVNADAPAQAHVIEAIGNARAASATNESIAVPDIEAMKQADPLYMAEARTWYACARLRVLPWWLGQATTGVIVTDADIEWLRSPCRIWETMGNSAAGSPRFESRWLGEQWYMTLAAFRSSPRGREIANQVATYVSRFLDSGDGIWSLDQMALWSIFAKFGSAVGAAPATSGDIAALPTDLVRQHDSPGTPMAVLSTSTGSLQNHPRWDLTSGD